MNVAQELDELLGLGKRQRPLPKTLQASGYNHVRELGAGGFGAALLLYNTKTKEHVVAKHINLSQMSLKSRKLAHNEITILQQMKHPNIVRYIEYTEEHPHLYILMEYADGGDLYSLIKKMKARKQPLNEEQIVALFLQVVMAIQYMHEQKVLHRDIKSQNVFLTKSHVVKLGDFGISTVLQNTVAMAKTMCGTPCYFSPELCRGEEYNNKSDVWALGILLYEMCALKLPFETINMKKLLESIVRDPTPRIPGNYSSSLSQLCSMMLEKDPSKRPDINGVLRHPVLRDRIPGLAQQLSEVCPKRELLAAAGVGSGGTSPRKTAAPALASPAGSGGTAGVFLGQREPSPYGGAVGRKEDVGLGMKKKIDVEIPPPPPPAVRDPVVAPYRQQAQQVPPQAPPLAPSPTPAQQQQPPQAQYGGGLGIMVPSRIAREAAKERGASKERSFSPPPAALPPARMPSPPVDQQPTNLARSGSSLQQEAAARKPRVVPSSAELQFRDQQQQQQAPQSPAPVQIGSARGTTPPPPVSQHVHQNGSEALMLAERPVEVAVVPPPPAAVAAGREDEELSKHRQQLLEEEDEYNSLVSVIKNLETLERAMTPHTSPSRARTAQTGVRTSHNGRLGTGNNNNPVVTASPPPRSQQQQHAPDMLDIEYEHEQLQQQQDGPRVGTFYNVGDEDGYEVLEDEEMQVESFADPFGTRLEGLDCLPDEDLDEEVHTDYGDLSATSGGGGSHHHQGGTVLDLSNPPQALGGGGSSASGMVTSENDIDDNTTFDVLCFCEKTRLVGDFTSIYGSFTCKCFACTKLSGAAALELLHLPELGAFNELSVEPLIPGNMRDPNESLMMPRSFKHPSDGTVSYFCSTCGSLLGMDHAGLSGCVVVKNALSQRSLNLLLSNQHENPPTQ